MKYQDREWDYHTWNNYFFVKYLGVEIICGDAKMMREIFLLVGETK
ncbi:MAG: hypothetical protein IPP27_02230 [Bacteroidetes bacterium]|nr:hypothetical protein [Bacteroidota bacterium]